MFYHDFDEYDKQFLLCAGYPVVGKSLLLALQESAQVFCKEKKCFYAMAILLSSARKN